MTKINMATSQLTPLSHNLKPRQTRRMAALGRRNQPTPPKVNAPRESGPIASRLSETASELRRLADFQTIESNIAPCVELYIGQEKL
jgi:hypothetical protein